MSPDDKSTNKDWRDLAERASKESDPVELQRLVQELCDALDHRTSARERVKPVNKKNDVVE